MPSTGYTSSARMSPPPGAYFEVPAAAFGVPIPGVFVASDVGSGGSLNANGFLKITWITANGESLPSAEVSRTVSGGPSGSISIAQPTVPTGGAPVVAWRLYAGTVTNIEFIAVNTTQVTQAQSNFTTSQGVLLAFPIATTTLTLKVYPTTGAGVPVTGASGAQQAFPSVGANSTADYFFRVPNSGALWKIQKSVDYMRPSSTAETVGISVAGNMDCIAPVYPGTSTGVTAGTGSYMVLNGYLFWATTTGTTASTFIGFSAFNLAVGGTTTDGSVVWTCLGKAVLVRAHFMNSTSGALYPAVQEYDLFQF